MTANQALAVAHLQELYPQALVEDDTANGPGVVRVSDLAHTGDSADQGGEFIVGPNGQVIDPGFVIPDQPGSEGLVPRRELILKDPPEAGWELR
jgi:hypothetical protein